MHMFRKEADYEAFERVMVEAHQREPIRILAYCILSNDVKDIRSTGRVGSARRETGLITTARSGGPGCREQASSHARASTLTGHGGRGECAAWPILRWEAVGPPGRRLCPIQFQPIAGFIASGITLTAEPSARPPVSRSLIRAVVSIIPPTCAIPYLVNTYGIGTRYADYSTDMHNISHGIKIQNLVKHADYSTHMRKSLAYKHIRRKWGYADCSTDMRNPKAAMDLRRHGEFRLCRRPA
jgi:hypothetical protein